jgi:predicted NBD/HSP70 family sugar kinase
MVIGIDIGATHIRILARTKNGLSGEKIHTPKSLAEFKKTLLSLVRQYVPAQGGNTSKLKGIGLSVAGYLDPQKVIWSANAKFLNGLRLPLFLKQNFKIPVLMDNDARCMARAEMTAGAGHGHLSAICVTLGTGLGGALVVNGKVWNGAHYTAGEIGHTLFRNSQLENFASSKFLNKSQNYQKFGQNLGDGLTSAIHLFDPEIIILGGGIMQEERKAKPILTACRARVAANLKNRPASKVKIKRGELGDYAGALGAALLFS